MASPLNSHRKNNQATLYTSQNDLYPTQSLPPDEITPASVSLMPAYNRFSSASQQTILIIKEIEDIVHSPAIRPLPYNALGPLVIKTPLVIEADIGSLQTNELGPGPGVIWDVDNEESVIEDQNFGIDDEQEDNEEEPSDEEDGEDDKGSEDGCEEDTRYHSWESRQPPSIQAAREALTDLNRILKPPRAKGGGYKECQLPL